MGIGLRKMNSIDTLKTGFISIVWRHRFPLFTFAFGSRFVFLCFFFCVSSFFGWKAKEEKKNEKEKPQKRKEKRNALSLWRSHPVDSCCASLGGTSVLFFFLNINSSYFLSVSSSSFWIVSKAENSVGDRPSPPPAIDSNASLIERNEILHPPVLMRIGHHGGAFYSFTLTRMDPFDFLWTRKYSLVGTNAFPVNEMVEPVT